MALPLLHTTLVSAFLAVTAALLVLTVYQRLRINDRIMFWHRSSAAQAWPVAFVGVIALLALYAFNTGTSVPSWVFWGYVAGGALWFGAAVLGTAVVVSSHGLVAGMGRRETTLPWCQVTDYFEVRNGRKTRFVFLYRKANGESRRLEVGVPAQRIQRFRLIVSERLEQRSLRIAEPIRGKRATS